MRTRRNYISMFPNPQLLLLESGISCAACEIFLRRQRGDYQRRNYRHIQRVYHIVGVLLPFIHWWSTSLSHSMCVNRKQQQEQPDSAGAVGLALVWYRSERQHPGEIGKAGFNVPGGAVRCTGCTSTIVIHLSHCTRWSSCTRTTSLPLSLLCRKQVARFCGAVSMGSLLVCVLYFLLHLSFVLDWTGRGL